MARCIRCGRNHRFNAIGICYTSNLCTCKFNYLLVDYARDGNLYEVKRIICDGNYSLTDYENALNGSAVKKRKRTFFYLWHAGPGYKCYLTANMRKLLSYYRERISNRLHLRFCDDVAELILSYVI